MRITAEISLYPLKEAFVAEIQDFIRALRQEPDLEILTTQTSTLVRGDFERVAQALHRGMRLQMERDGTVVFVAKYINADLDIRSFPQIADDA